MNYSGNSAGAAAIHMMDPQAAVVVVLRFSIRNDRERDAARTIHGRISRSLLRPTCCPRGAAWKYHDAESTSAARGFRRLTMIARAQRGPLNSDSVRGTKRRR